MHVPEKVSYYLRPKEKCFGEEVFPAWPIDFNGNSKAAETWAQYQNQKEIPAAIVGQSNLPFGRIKLLDLETRGHGGRAWKIAFFKEGICLLADLREDVLLEVLKGPGIVGGELQGEYLWIWDGGLKLVLKDGECHKKAMENGARKALKSLSKLELGGVYRDLAGREFLYLGRIDSEDLLDLDGERFEGDLSFCLKNEIKIVSIRGHELWLMRPDIKSLKLDFVKNSVTMGWYYQHVKNKKVIEKIDQVNLPANHLLLIRNKLSHDYHWLNLMRGTGESRPGIPLYDRFFESEKKN